MAAVRAAVEGVMGVLGEGKRGALTATCRAGKQKG